MGVVSRRWVWVESMGVVVRRYIDFLILLVPTSLVSAPFCNILFILKMFFVLVKVLFCNLCNNFFTQYKHIQATTGFPRKQYEGLHITKKNTQTNVSYPVMDISCMPSRAGCRSRSRGRALYRDASRAVYVLSPLPPPSRGGDLELEGGISVFVKIRRGTLIWSRV